MEKLQIIFSKCLGLQDLTCQRKYLVINNFKIFISEYLIMMNLMSGFRFSLKIILLKNLMSVIWLLLLMINPDGCLVPVCYLDIILFLIIAIQIYKKLDSVYWMIVSSMLFGRSQIKILLIYKLIHVIFFVSRKRIRV